MPEELCDSAVCTITRSSLYKVTQPEICLMILKIWKYIVSFFLAMSAALGLSSAALAQTVTDYPLRTIGGKDTFITNTSPYGYFGRAEYLLVGGTSAYQYRSMMSWDMTKLPALGTGDKAELIFYGLSITGYAPTAMELGMSATAWTDADPWKIFNWYSTVNKIVPATPYDNWMAVDITNWYNYWKSGQIVNNGILFLPSTSSNKYTAPASTEISNLSIRPFVRVTRVVAPSNKTTLKWPLTTAYSSRVMTQAFGADWSGGNPCGGKAKKHTGADYRATKDTVVSAAQAGVIKTMFFVYGWANVMTLEHAKLDGTKYTTTYWHVSPNSDMYVGKAVAKGDPIAKVADLAPYGNATHFHFGLHNGAYALSNGKDVPTVGALPQTDCDGWPAFPEKFLNPEADSGFQMQ